MIDQSKFTYLASVKVCYSHLFAMPPTLPTKKTRCRINNAQHKEICEYSKKHPSAKHQEISEEFTR